MQSSSTSLQATSTLPSTSTGSTNPLPIRSWPSIVPYEDSSQEFNEQLTALTSSLKLVYQKTVENMPHTEQELVENIKYVAEKLEAAIELSADYGEDVQINELFSTLYYSAHLSKEASLERNKCMQVYVKTHQERKQLARPLFHSLRSAYSRLAPLFQNSDSEEIFVNTCLKLSLNFELFPPIEIGKNRYVEEEKSEAKIEEKNKRIILNGCKKWEMHFLIKWQHSPKNVIKEKKQEETEIREEMVICFLQIFSNQNSESIYQETNAIVDKWMRFKKEEITDLLREKKIYEAFNIKHPVLSLKSLLADFLYFRGEHNKSYGICHALELDINFWLRAFTQDKTPDNLAAKKKLINDLEMLKDRMVLRKEINQIFMQPSKKIIKKQRQRKNREAKAEEIASLKIQEQKQRKEEDQKREKQEAEKKEVREQETEMEKKQDHLEEKPTSPEETSVQKQKHKQEPDKTQKKKEKKQQRKRKKTSKPKKEKNLEEKASLPVTLIVTTPTQTDTKESESLVTITSSLLNSPCIPLPPKPKNKKEGKQKKKKKKNKKKNNKIKQLKKMNFRKQELILSFEEGFPPLVSEKRELNSPSGSNESHLLFQPQSSIWGQNKKVPTKNEDHSPKEEFPQLNDPKAGSDVKSERPRLFNFWEIRAQNKNTLKDVLSASPTQTREENKSPPPTEEFPQLPARSRADTPVESAERSRPLSIWKTRVQNKNTPENASSGNSIPSNTSSFSARKTASEKSGGP